MTTANRFTKSDVGFHEGSTLLRVAGTYPTLQEVLLEAVQNSLDKNSSSVQITINQKARSISIRDNGDGVNVNEFEHALSSVGHTIKKESALGRFGLGLVSPVGKCAKYTFTSTPRDNPRGYVEWSFVSDSIREQHSVEIPYNPLPKHCYGDGRSNHVHTYVNWRTEVRLERYTMDRYVSRISMETLAESIISKFNTALRRKNAVVKIIIIGETGIREEEEVRFKEYEGNKMPELKVDNQEGGRTFFRLYLAKKAAKGRAGKVTVGEQGNDFRVPFYMFCKNLPDEMRLSEDVQHALLSGTFEGDILSSRARFHANRRGFEADDALMGFCLAIQEWYDQQGSIYFQEAQASRQDERYQDLGIRSMKVLEALLKSPQGSNLMDAVKAFKFGSIGDGHTPKPGKLTDLKYIHDGESHTGEGDAKVEGSGSGSKSLPKKEIPTHHPFVTAGPRGQRRKLVRSNSLGVSLAHEPLPSNKLWDLDQTTGTLTLNVRHPVWVECSERSDRVLMRFQEFLMVQALSVLTFQEDWRIQAELVLEGAAIPYAFTILNGDYIAGRGPGRRRKDDSAEGKPTKTRSLVLGKRLKS